MVFKIVHTGYMKRGIKIINQVHPTDSMKLGWRYYSPDFSFVFPKNKDLTKRDIYCTGPLLRAVQNAHVFPSSETFVNKKMKFPVSDVMSNYYNLTKYFGGRSPAHEALMMFVDENFEDGHELEDWLPTDWKVSPKILDVIIDEKLKTWATELNSNWKSLGRMISDDVQLQPDLYSMIPLPHSFILESSGSTELHYSDSFWTLKGLLVCGMDITAKDILNNLLYLVKTYGYVPSGSRVYYENRSSKPVLTIMMDIYYRYTLDFEFIRENIEIVEKEIEFWLKNRTVVIVKDGLEYEVFHYSVKCEGPRPEAYSEDIQSGTLANTNKELESHFQSIKSASESTWSFSTRWFVLHGFNHGSRSNTLTPHIIPVDLNAVMQRNFDLLKRWYARIGNKEKMRHYRIKSEELLSAIENVFWNEKDGIWQDYDFQNQKSRNYFYISNFTPLWTKSYRWSPEKMTRAMLKYLNKYDADLFTAGVPTSNEHAGEKWDFPNIWPHLQLILISGLDKIGTHVASDVAFHFANKFIQTSFKGYNEHGTIFSSYNCLIPGRFGIGIESFELHSRTLGVIFILLERWGKDFRLIQ